MQKLAWAAVLITAGGPPSAVVVPAAAPATPKAPLSPVAAATEPRPCWFAVDDEDLVDDEFEGEGWTFWGL